MFRNILSSTSPASVDSSSSAAKDGGKSTTTASVKTATTQKPKESCPHCNHSFLNSLKSHLRLNRSCGTKQLVDAGSEPRIKKPASSSSSNKAKFFMSKQGKLDKIDTCRSMLVAEQLAAQAQASSAFASPSASASGPSKATAD